MRANRELELARAFYLRARKNGDRREMARQAREIDYLARHIIRVQIAGGLK